MAPGKQARAHHEGDQLTVEVDESQTIIGVHDLQFDLQISQTPPAGSSAYVLLTGRKLKSNFVFFRTPVGVVMINQNRDTACEGRTHFDFAY